MNEVVSIPCPYCGQSVLVEPEPSDDVVEYVDDCPICCRPMVISVTYSDQGSQVTARREND